MPETIKHIYWFAYFNKDEPSVRYRGLYPLQKLQKDYGISYTIVYPGYNPKNIIRFIRTFFTILLFRKHGSVIVFEKLRTRRLYVSFLKVLLKFRSRKTLYDIDDADYLKFPPQNINYYLKNVSACTAGSNALLQYAKQYNEKVFYLTSPVIDHRYRKHKRNDCFTVGWIGYYNAHKNSLWSLLFPALKNSSFPVKIVLLGVRDIHRNEIEAFFATNANVTIDIPQNIDWLDENSIYSKIAEFDVGIAPLLDTQVNNAKSAFKLKQYLSCGVPALASAVGENTNYIKQGVNGYLCNTIADFEEKIKYLQKASDAEYWALSQNAIDSTPQFSMDNYCYTLVQACNSL